MRADSPSIASTGPGRRFRAACLALSLLVLCWIPATSGAVETPSIRFLGGAQMVGGSSCLIDTGTVRLLIDFGLFYGADRQEENKTIPFDPAGIDYVLLTHAHIDHSGRVPLLYKHGFKGRVIGTDATMTLLGIMLEMNMKYQDESIGESYSWQDYAQTMKHFMTVPYGEIIRLGDDVSLRFQDAGHILGSGMIELWMKSGNRAPGSNTVKLVATGDMGSGGAGLLRDPAPITEADYILTESTYGALERKDSGHSSLGREIRKALDRGGSVLIPSFVLEKTQKVIYAIGKLKREGVIPREVPVFSDSTSAQEITRAYRKYTKYYSAEATAVLASFGDPLSFPNLREVSASEALAHHNRNASPAIYISASAMLDHANAPRHLEKMIEDPKNLLALVGWQAPGSVGGRLLRGAERIAIPMEEKEGGKRVIRYVEKSVRMEVGMFHAFSSHADGCQILQWLSRFPKVKEVFVVHGEKEGSLQLAGQIHEKLGFKASAPRMGDVFPLAADAVGYSLKSFTSERDICAGMQRTPTISSMTDQ